MNLAQKARALPIAAGLLVLIGGSAEAAAPAPQPVGVEASIPFASHNIYTWEADGDRGIWVQTLNKQWYYGKFSFPCFGLQFRNGVAFKFGPSGELDHWGELIRVDHTNCLFSSFVTSLGPPRPQKTAPAAPAATPPPAQPAPATNPG